MTPALRTVAIVALAYVGIVVAFESSLGWLQPRAGSTMVITTFDGNGSALDRVVSRLESDGRLYVASNHWPRSWYRRALQNPAVQITIDGERRDYQAVPVTGAERDRVEAEHRLGLGLRILTGFPPRYFVRLDPRPPSASNSSSPSGNLAWHGCRGSDQGPRQAGRPRVPIAA